MKITLRKFRSADTAFLISLYYDTIHTINILDYSDEQVNAWAPSKTDNISKWKERFKESYTIVAKINNVIAGFGNLKDGNGIDMLYVHKDLQRKGVASALLKKLERKLKKNGVTHVRVESSITARPFFEHQGYSLVRQNRKSFNDAEFINFTMAKKLDPKSKGEHMKKKKKAGLFWKNFFTNKAFDLLIVILGVTIAFQLNSFKQNNDEKSLEKFYLESMIHDLDSDILEYNDNLNELLSDRKLVHACLARMEKQEDVTDSLGLVVLNILSIKTFEGHRNAYSTITSGNGLSLIKDPAIRNMMLEHYRLYAAIERFEGRYSNLISRAHDYFSLYIDYNHVDRIENSILLENVQTKNILTVAAVQLQDGLWRYEESIEKAKALKESIGSYLNH